VERVAVVVDTLTQVGAVVVDTLSSRPPHS